MKKILSSLLVLVTLGALQSCQQQPEKTAATDQKFLDTSAMDPTVKPGDNFFLYVNGGWIKKTPIPPTESRVGSVLTLFNQTKEHLHLILEDLAKGGQTAGSIEQKVGDFYASGMDTITIDKLGYNPVKPDLQKIDAIKNPKDIMQYVAEQQTRLNSILFGAGIAPDDKNSSMNIAGFVQGGLGLPDRDYYFKTDPATLAVIKAYQTYGKKIFTLVGYDSVTAAKKMMGVYNLEKKIAESHKTNVALRDPQNNYHKVAVSEMDKRMPAFGWKSTLGTMGVTLDSINVQQPEFFKKVNELLTSVPIDTWKDYLRFHTLDNSGTALTTDFVNARFEYYGKALSGQQQMKPRWDRMASATDNNLGEALGQVYSKKYFTEDAKKRMLELVNNLQVAFEARIGKLDWMTDETKTKAKEKLHAFLKQIGYPDKWRDYSNVTIDRGKYFENLESAANNEYKYQISKQGKPVDKTEWDMTPPTINAGYYPTFNKIVFPAGILQFPFFDLNADDAINYGAIGMVIGHEITHGFDDQGAQYDKDGNLKNWWDKEDSVKFAAKTKLVIDQYNGFIAIDTMHVNGALTAGENIADLGGLNIAYDAFKMTKQGQGNEKIDGFTPDQRFFMAYAQIAKGKRKDELARRLVNVDPHSPEMWRVNGPLTNFAPFYAAYNLQPGDKMYKEEKDRIKIW